MYRPKNTNVFQSLHTILLFPKMAASFIGFGSSYFWSIPF